MLRRGKTKYLGFKRGSIFFKETSSKQLYVWHFDIAKITKTNYQIKFSPGNSSFKSP